MDDKYLIESDLIKNNNSHITEFYWKNKYINYCNECSQHIAAHIEITA